MHTVRINGELVPSLIAKAYRKEGLPRYVAISHVWRHGLGSTTEDGLSICQMHELDDISRNETTSTQSQSLSVPFWMDSLCVPASKKHRRLAISSINTVFEACEQVIVLDKSLRTLKYMDDSDQSRLAAIACSAWRTRLWTFLEGYAAPTLTIRFRDYTHCLKDHGVLSHRSNP